MRSKIISLLTGIIVSVSLLSCSTDKTGKGGGDEIDPNRVAAIVQAGFNTRAADGQWDANDAIGITMLNAGTTTVRNEVYNYEYTTPSGDGNFTPVNEANTVYFPQDGDAVRFVSYYPYRSNLSTDFQFPVSTREQTTLPMIDLMTAEHENGTTKDDPNVSLRFYHRLSKVIFVFENADEVGVLPQDLSVTIQGMYTEGIYNMLSENWTVDNATAADMTLPYRGNANQRYGIVLPRPAGEGISFEFTTPDGGLYTADMSDDLALEKGHQYTFYITLSKTPVTVSAVIEEWIDGPDTYYDAVLVGTDAGESEGVLAGERMRVYAQENGIYGLINTYTYEEDGTWTPDSLVYWEDITSDPANLRAAITRAAALNTTQIPDYLIADDLSVPHNTGANFVLRHAGSKITVQLSSDTFSDTDLENATITLPNYLTGATEQNGSLIAGTDRRNIQVDRTDPDNGVAIIQPQDIAANNGLVTVTINGRAYTATQDTPFSYAGGTAYLFRVALDKVGVSISATVVDWDEQEFDLTAVTVGTATSGGTGLLDQEVMAVYTDQAIDRPLLTNYTYNAGTNTFTPTNTVYWENLPNAVTFYASILRAPRINNTQLDDYLVATPVRQTASNGVDFRLRHAAAKVVVQMRSETFTDEELRAMSITLPNYTTGGTVVNGLYERGTGSGNIVIRAANDPTDNNIALIDEQTIQDRTVVSLVDPATGRTYTAEYPDPILFRAGYETELYISVEKTGITISANVVDWQETNPLELLATRIRVDGNLAENADFFRSKTIYLYDVTDPTNIPRYAYTYEPDGNDGHYWEGPKLYWDDLEDQSIDFTAVYFPSNVPDLPTTQNYFNWDLPNNQSGGWENYDLMMAHLELNYPQHANFLFKHVVSGVRVEIEVDNSQFPDAELEGLTMQLNNFILDGNALLTTGAIQVTGTPENLTPYTVTDGYTYSALVMPQTIPNKTQVVTITLPDYPATPFMGYLDEGDLVFEPGQFTIITVRLSKTEIKLSARLEEWVDGNTGGIIID